MDVLTLARTLLRRWYVLVPVLALTGVGVYLFAYRQSPPQTTQGSMLIATPELQPPEEAAGEGGSATEVISPWVLAELMTDAEVTQRIVEAGGSEDYRVTVAGEERLLRVTGVADDANTAIQTVDLVLGELEDVAERRQEEAGVPQDERLVLETLSHPATAAETAAEQEGEIRLEAMGSARLSGRFGDENPYSSSGFTFAVLDQLFSSDQGSARLEEAGAEADYTMDLEESIVEITVTGETSDAAMGTYETLTRELSAELEARQEELGIPSAERTRLQPLADPVGTTADSADLVRPLVTVAGLGLVVAVGLTLLVDNLVTGVAARRRFVGGDAGSPSQTTSEGDPPVENGTVDGVGARGRWSLPEVREEPQSARAEPSSTHNSGHPR